MDVMFNIFAAFSILIGILAFVVAFWVDTSINRKNKGLPSYKYLPFYTDIRNDATSTVSVSFTKSYVKMKEPQKGKKCSVRCLDVDLTSEFLYTSQSSPFLPLPLS